MGIAKCGLSALTKFPPVGTLIGAVPHQRLMTLLQKGSPHLYPELDEKVFQWHCAALHYLLLLTPTVPGATGKLHVGLGDEIVIDIRNGHERTVCLLCYIKSHFII